MPVDNTAPSAVQNLNARWNADTVELHWTAPGDEGTTGRALRYDIRYSTSPITEANWNQASKVTREPYPAPSGTATTFTVPDSLSSGTTYWLAMKSKDEEGNWSAMSNVDDTTGGQCSSSEECSDGVYCNGAEACVSESCQAGAAVDCSPLDVPCSQKGVCDEGADACVAQPVSDGSACDDGNTCTGAATGQCWSGVCQTISAFPVTVDFGGAGGGIAGTGFTHLLPSTNGGYLPANLSLGSGILTVTTTSGDLGRESSGGQNDQHNALALRVDGTAGKLRVAARLLPPWDIVNDYQSAGVLFGTSEDNYIKLTVFHNSGAFGGAADNNPDNAGFQVGIERSSAPGTVQELNTKYPPADGLQSVSTMDLFLELDPATDLATACYRANGGAITILQQGIALGTPLFTGCSYASIVHTSNDFVSNVPEPPAWHPHYDWFRVTPADQDGDAYTVCGGDRDDANAAVHPGATEICDGLDNDQDESVDEGGNALCDDGNSCTTDLCAGAAGCQHSGVDCLGITGTVTYYRTSDGQEPGTAKVGGTLLALQGATQTRSTSSAADTGAYAFISLSSENMTVSPSKTGGINGVSSLDATRIAQFRVGLYPMTPNQRVAGDVSGNGSISSYDATLVSQFRVGIITRFPAAVAHASDWAFVPASRSYQPLASDRTGEDYTAILYGDVTGNWAPQESAGIEREDASLVAPWGDLDARTIQAASRFKTARAGTTCKLILLAPRGGRDAPPADRLVLRAEGCQGLLGLDLDVVHAGKVPLITSASSTDRTSRFTFETSDQHGVLRISMFSPVPLDSDGDLLVLALSGAHRLGTPRFFISQATANEGSLPLSFSPGAGASANRGAAREERP